MANVGVVLALLAVTLMAAGQKDFYAQEPGPAITFTVDGEFSAVRAPTVTYTQLNGLEALLAKLRGATLATSQPAGPGSRDEATIAAKAAASRLGVSDDLMVVSGGSYEGQSAGLAQALALEGAGTQLFGVYQVMATGTIDASGQVGPVGGIEAKLRSARELGVDVIFVELSQQERALEAASSEVEVVGVRTDIEAIAWLCSHGGGGKRC